MLPNAEMLLFTAVMVSFLAALIGLTAVLSIARQLRIRLARRTSKTLELAPLPTLGPVTILVEEDTQPTLPVMDLAPTKPSDAVLERMRAALRAAKAGSVTLAVEPESGPTQQQRAVQRLIEYLKEESTKSPAPVGPV